MEGKCQKASVHKDSPPEKVPVGRVEQSHQLIGFAFYPVKERNCFHCN